MQIEGRETILVFATCQDLPRIKALAGQHRQELGFVNRATLESAVGSGEILNLPHGFLHFHHRRDKISTLYHLCVAREFRRQGVGRTLIKAWESHSQQDGIQLLGLKCPLDVEANRFYTNSANYYYRCFSTGRRIKDQSE